MNSHNIFEGALFHPATVLNPDKKGGPFFLAVYFYLLSRTCDANFTHTRTLYTMFAYHFILHTH